MSRASKRRQSSKAEESGGNWMDTYGDLVTLLLTFFVLLFSFSTIDAAKWESLVGALSGTTSMNIPALNPEMAMERPIGLIMTTEDATSMPEQAEDNVEDVTQVDAGNTELELENFKELYIRIDTFITENNLFADIFVDYEDYTIIVRFADNVFFESGQADILLESQPILDYMAVLLSDNLNRIARINIEGHTDNVPINTAQYPSNWELSVSRAVNTLRYLLDTKLIGTDIISAVGYSEYHPVKPNDTIEGRAANRRVDFVVQGIKSN